MRMSAAFALVLVLALSLVPALVRAQDAAPDKALETVSGAFGWELGRVLEGDADARKITELMPLVRLLDATPPNISRHFSFYNVFLCKATRQIQGIIAIQTFADMEEATRHFQTLRSLLEEKYGPSLEDPEDKSAYLAGEPDTGASVRLSPPVDDGTIIKVVIEYYDDPLWDSCMEQAMDAEHAKDLDAL